MNDSKQPRVWLIVECIQQPLIGHMLSKLGPYFDDLGSVAASYLDNPPAKEPGVRDDHNVSRLDETGKAGLHPRGAGRLQREHQAPRAW